MVEPSRYRVEPERLRRRCDPGSLDLTTTADIAPLEVAVGQPRALEAIEFGLDMKGDGYNVFATGPIGTGKRTIVADHLGSQAAARPAPPDLVHVFDFAHPERPLALTLQSGSGPDLAEDARQLVAEARRRIREAFDSQTYADRRKVLTEELERRGEEILGELRGFAQERQFSLELTPAGIVTFPVVEGKPVSPQEFEGLPEPMKASFATHAREIEQRMPDAMRQMREIEREARSRLRALDGEVAGFAVGHLVEELKARYADVERLGTWFDAALEDMVENLPRMRAEDEPPGALPAPMAGALSRGQEGFFARYEANVLVSHDPAGGAPVVFAEGATFYELFGRIEYETAFGAVSTDHRMIRPGAVHRANGGYLVLQAADVLTQPFVWRKLKELVRTRMARIENVGAQLMLFPTATPEPEPFEVDLKLVLIAPPELYGFLFAYDEDMRKLFKVRADFQVDMPWDGHAARAYAAFISRRVRDQGLAHFDREAVARVVEEGARAVSDQGRLSTRFVDVANLVDEAGHMARKAGSEVVHREDVDAAVAGRMRRSNLVEEKMQEMIAEGTLFVDVTGAKVGQVNGLAVTMVGDYAFGRPVRITASVAAGSDGLVNIDRETELSGPVHDKGFLILAGFLRERFSRDTPLSLVASLVFEQSYQQVEGDSAAAAELFALLSALADRPLAQHIAVTGSVNQKGAIQPVGGVNEKVEGFFEVCRQSGLTGDQGVIVPAANVRNLMLKDEVVDAVREGSFHVWAVSTVDEGMELLTGVPAGERGAAGAYPEGTLGEAVEERLRSLSRSSLDALRAVVGDGGHSAAPAR
jgi:lon-related putative ATP-dependent protease